MTDEWGDDRSLIGGWVLRGAYAWRVLLPAETSAGRISWREIAALHDNPGPSDGYVTWGEITAWPGSGPPGPADCQQPCFPDDEIASRLRECLTRVVGSQPWLSEAGTASMAQVVLSWQQHRDLGRWSSSGYGLAAPAFADSVMISGPKSFGAVLLQGGFEAWSIAPSRPLPPMIG